MKDTNSNNNYLELQIQSCNLYLENKGFGTARGGRLPCKQDVQMGSIPISSIRIKERTYAVLRIEMDCY